MTTYNWKSKHDHTRNNYFDKNGEFSILEYGICERDVLKSVNNRYKDYADDRHIDYLNDSKYINANYFIKRLEFVPIAMEKSTKKPISKGWNQFTLKKFDEQSFNNDVNVSILTGRPSMIFVLDIDVPKEGETDGLKFLDAWYNQCKDKSHILEGGRHYADTLVQKSGGGGYHFFYTYEPIFDLIRTSARDALHYQGHKLSIDIKSNGGNITFTPSIHKNGNKYELLKDFNGIETAFYPKMMPRWLLHAIMHTMQRNNIKFNHVGSNVVAKFDKEGKRITPAENIESKPIIQQNIDILHDNIPIIVSAINKDRWDNYDTWYKMVFGLRHLSAQSGNKNKYRKLCHELSKTSSKYDEDEVDSMWEKDNSKDSIGIGTFIIWMKEDCTKEQCKAIFRDMNLFFTTGKYTWADATKMHKKDYLDKDDRNDIYDFIKSCVFPIRSAREGITYTIRSVEYDVDYGKKYYSYNSLKPSQLTSHIGNVMINNASQSKAKDGSIIYNDKSLMKIIESFSLEFYYSNLCFMPYSPYSNKDNVMRSMKEFKTFNLFNGFCNEYQPDFKVDMKLIQPALQQINEFCVDNKQHFDFFITWLAHMVQYPNIKTGVMTIIKSNDQGTGKTTFFNWFGSTVIGKQYYASISDISKVTGKFNSAIAGKILTVMEEIDVFEGNRAVNAELKNLITNKHQMIEFKGREPVQIEDCCNYVILTNKDHIVKVEGSDRRFFLLECKRIRPVNDPHWKYMNEVFYKNPETSLHFYHYLMSIKDVRSGITIIPDTELKNEAKRRNAPAVIEMLYNHYIRKYVELGDNDGTIIFGSLSIVEEVKQVMSDRGYNGTANTKNIATDIKNEFGITSKRINIDGERRMSYEFTKTMLEKAFDKYKFPYTETDLLE